MIGGYTNAVRCSPTCVLTKHLYVDFCVDLQVPSHPLNTVNTITEVSYSRFKETKSSVNSCLARYRNWVNLIHGGAWDSRWLQKELKLDMRRRIPSLGHGIARLLHSCFEAGRSCAKSRADLHSAISETGLWRGPFVSTTPCNARFIMPANRLTSSGTGGCCITNLSNVPLRMPGSYAHWVAFSRPEWRSTRSRQYT